MPDKPDESPAASGEKPGAAPSKSALEKTIDATLEVILSLPVPVRAAVVFLLLALALGLVYQKFFRPEQKKETTEVSKVLQTAPAKGPYLDGYQDPARPGVDNVQNRESDHKAAEDIEAVKWHFAHHEDDPEEKSIGTDADENNFLHYRYYERSDHCLLIIRKQGGDERRQWVRDPMYHRHDVDREKKQNARIPSFHETGDAPLLAGIAFENPAARALSALAKAASLNSIPVQSGYCANPHPGRFAYWWGQPFDYCNSPMYRQFSDGCTHYQLYNRCANAWDGRIFWTACNPPPHR